MRDLESVHARLAALPGGGTLMAPLSGAVVPYDISLDISYTNQGKWGNFTYSDMTYYSDPKSNAGVFDSGVVSWISVAEGDASLSKLARVPASARASGFTCGRRASN